MRINVVIPLLWGGGAERVAAALVSGWAEQGHQVVVLTFADEAGRRHALHGSVEIRPLRLLQQSGGPLQGLMRNVRRLRVLRQAVRHSKPDVVISFIDKTNVLTLLATRGLGIPVIISERTDPLLHCIGWIWSLLRKFCYPLADWLVCPTGRSLARFQRMSMVRGSTITNPIVLPAMNRDEQPTRGAEGRVLVAMGRLVAQKGFDLLLDAFSQIAARHPEWSLTIIGEGPLRSDLERQCRILRLHGRVRFAGELADPFPVLRAADLFVFSSRFEGFGMALAEAMACGLPAVSFDCPEGPGDIIRDGVDGVLVPPQDVDALAVALDELMGDDAKRERLAARAREVLERFSVEQVFASWGQLLTELVPVRDVTPARVP